MEKSTLRFLILGLLLTLASVVQSFDGTVFGVAPNLVLIVIVVSTLFLQDIGHKLFLVALASFFLKFSPVANFDIAAFFFVGLALIFIERLLPWHALVNGIFLMLCATSMLYLLIDRASIVSLMFPMELGYNILLIYVLSYGLAVSRLFRHR